MSFNRIIAVFGIILFLFAIVVFYLYSLRPKVTQQSNQLLMGTVTIDNQAFTVELATTSAQQEKGLSNHSPLQKNHGMLFVFPTPSYYSFWMRQMEFPIDIIFIRDDHIISIKQNAPPPKEKQTTSLPLYQPSEPVNMVLEINAGLSKDYNFHTGDTVTITK